MSRWCDTCHRNEITGEWKSCTKDCPVFGKAPEEIENIAIEMKNSALVDKIASFFEEEENWKALKNCWLENDKSNDLRKLLHEALKG
jgi:hypothetical protein